MELKLFSSKPEVDPGNDISNLFKGIFPNPWVMLATFIALIIVVLVLYGLVFKPIRKSISERRKFIQDNIDESIKNRESSIELENKRNLELWEARIAAAGIVNQAKIESEKIANEYIVNAKKEAKRIIEDGHKSVAQQQKKFEEESREEIISVATKLASKILEKHVSHYEEEELINKLLNEVYE
ncbi:F0F1 ATP synthase subunit B [Mesomycoplasma lagogenitalium]|uniref:ATP synthase subunit b n=1 Tax=Mesomycoplasma lagogenitalium TaxID=171286 RepID=A0ABY8LVF5_9BACT|nr:F0F1 ATP synthase subunit B [Mesomycoplasma lagogenitalium]WGI36251.1 F0F1 ATP synthase subunit B [Mesomycoplasma lagogenitalium]